MDGMSETGHGSAWRELYVKMARSGLNWSPVITHQQCDNRQRLMYRRFSLAHLKNRYLA